MRPLDPVVLRTLASVLVATGLAVACSSSDSGAVPDATLDGGPATPADAAGDSAPPPQACTRNEECSSGVCNVASGVCEAPSCADGVKNGAETDMDCGGGCDRCDQQKTCAVGADCKDGVCADTGAGLRCQPPTSTDGVRNGGETGVDCGGAGNPKCADGQGCAVWDDCTSGYCKTNICTATTPADGVQNGTETDLDCGGTGNPRCDDDLKCLVDADCKSDVCKDTAGVLRCQVPTPTDGKKNGTETDVDCGGAGAPKCVAGKACLVGTDCKSAGCNYQLKCAAGRSCTARYGGDTCGLGGEGGVGAAQWEDCCKTAAVTTASGGTVYMDKYQVTAGRMRAFLTAVGYDVRAFVQQARADGKIPTIPVKVDGTTVDGVNRVLDASWDPFLPTGFAAAGGGGELSEGAQSCTGAGGGPPCAEGAAQGGIYTAIRNHLGGLIFRSNAQAFTGCYVGAPGTHSFRFPDNMQDGAAPAQGQDLYDTKSLNCVDYLVAQAFCVWDGGRLETFPEWQTAWGAGATPFSAATTMLPAEPSDRCIATSCTAGTVNADCGNPAAPNPPTWACVSNKCCLAAGDRTYWGCRFPWITDAERNGGGTCGLNWPATRTLEYANYKYSYEYPKLTGGDYIVHLSAPGRVRGRGPLGHADVIGAGFELTSSVDFVAYSATNRDSGPFQARHKWAGNGSWEVHGYNKTYAGNTMLLNKYGKLGMRCVKFASSE